MAYTPPIMNLNCNMWLIDGTIKPSNGAADVVGVECQKYLPSRGIWDLTPPWSAGFYLSWHPPVHIRLGRAGQFAGPWPTWKVCCIEVPQGSAQYYRAYWADVQHEGFVNEYVEWIGVQCDADLKAFPPPGGSQPTGVGADAGGFIPLASPPATVLPPGPFPPGVPPITTFLDTFTGPPGLDLSAHLADSGHTWIHSSGIAQIDVSGVGLVAIADGVNPTWYVNNWAGPATTPITLSFTSPSDLSFGMWIGVIIAATDGDNWLGVLLETPDLVNWNLSIYQCVAGVYSLLFTGANTFTPTVSTDYDFKLTFAPPLITAEISDAGGVVLTETFSQPFDTSVTSFGLWLTATSTIPTPLFRMLTR